MRLQVVGAAASSASVEVRVLSARGRTGLWSTLRYDCSLLLSAFLQSFDSPANLGLTGLQKPGQYFRCKLISWTLKPLYKYVRKPWLFKRFNRGAGSRTANPYIAVPFWGFSENYSQGASNPLTVGLEAVLCQHEALFPGHLLSLCLLLFCRFWLLQVPVVLTCPKCLLSAARFSPQQIQKQDSVIALPDYCPLLQPPLRINVSVMWLHIPFWLPTTISSTSLTYQIAPYVFVFLGRLLVGDVTAMSIPTYCFPGHPTPSALPGARRPPPCRAAPGRGGAASLCSCGRAGGRGEAPATCFSAAAAAAGLRDPGRALPGGRGPAPLPRSVPPSPRKMAAGRRSGAGSPSGRTDAQRPGADGPRPAWALLVAPGDARPLSLREPCPARSAGPPCGRWGGGGGGGRRGGAGPARSGSEGGGAERAALAGPGEVVPAGGDGHGWGRSVRGGRGVGGGGGAGRCGGRCPLPRSHLCGRGAPPGAHSVRGLFHQHGAPLPAVPGPKVSQPCPAAFVGRRALDTRLGAAAPAPSRLPPLGAPCAPAAGGERGPGPELRSRPHSSFVYPTASCCGRRGCWVRRDRRRSSRRAPGQGMLLSPWRGCGCTARAAHAAVWGLRSEQASCGYSCVTIKTQQKSHRESW